jgi:hypothetical protein
VLSDPSVTSRLHFSEPFDRWRFNVYAKINRDLRVRPPVEDDLWLRLSWRINGSWRVRVDFPGRITVRTKMNGLKIFKAFSITI